MALEPHLRATVYALTDVYGVRNGIHSTNYNYSI